MISRLFKKYYHCTGLSTSNLCPYCNNLTPIIIPTPSPLPPPVSQQNAVPQKNKIEREVELIKKIPTKKFVAPKLLR